MNFLLMHGWALDNWVFERVARELSERGEVFNINLPSHGGSRRWTTPDLAPAINGALEKINYQKHLVGIGWSLGAQALMRLSRAIDFKALVLVSATPRFTQSPDFSWGQPRSRVKRMINEIKTDNRAINRFYPLNFTPEEAQTPEASALIKRYAHPGPVVCREDLPGCFPAFDYEGITTALEALLKIDLRDDLDNMKMPVLITHGDRDEVTPVGAAKYLSEKIENCELEIIEGAGHAPFYTRHGEFMKTLTGFLGRI